MSEKNHTQIHLANERISYIMRVSDTGLLEHVYFGKKIHQPERVKSPHKRMYRCVSSHYQDQHNYSLQDVPQEFPVFGTSDYRQPIFHAVNKDGNSIFDFKYKSHRLLQHKPALESLPSTRPGDSETLEVELFDALQNVSVFLYYTLYQNHDVLTRSVKLLNHSDKLIKLEQLYSTCLDLPADEYEILHFGGSWSREFGQHRHALPRGRFVTESARGTSSAQNHPFTAILSPDTNETQGQVIGTALLYSGNFAISTETNEFGDVRVLAGLNPFNFSWNLKAGESFQTPEVLHVYSSQGLDAMSQTLHGFIRDHISPPQFSKKARPTYLNTWESCYFEVTEDKVYALAEVAKSLDLEMLVLDDGWFKHRTDDQRALGDWYADKSRFPNGIPALAKKVKALGLKFGIWVEPEMINPDSDLYRTHPEWALHAPGRKASTGRHQLTLDFSRDDVVAYIEERLDELFACGEIDYVKWDMNRTMTELGSAALAIEQQGEVAHRYMLNLYGLLERLTVKYPNILFENCASGGNRHDLGMLSYMNNSWVSDMSEPIDRLAIQNGASHIFPMSTYSSYICPSPGHQNGRYTSLATRFNVAFFCGSRGLSLSQTEIRAHHAELKACVQAFKASREDAVNGHFHRLIHTDNDVCWQLTSADSNTIHLGYFHILSRANDQFRRAYLRGLETEAIYAESQTKERFSGSELMHAGFGLPYVSTTQDYAGEISEAQKMDLLDTGDFVSKLITLKKVQ